MYPEKVESTAVRKTSEINEVLEATDEMLQTLHSRSRVLMNKACLLADYRQSEKDVPDTDKQREPQTVLEKLRNHYLSLSEIERKLAETIEYFERSLG